MPEPAASGQVAEGETEAACQVPEPKLAAWRSRSTFMPQRLHAGLLAPQPLAEQLLTLLGALAALRLGLAKELGELGVAVALRVKGAQTCSCSSPILVEETAK